MSRKQKINIHLYPGTLLFETRMYKIANTINKLKIFDKIYLLGINNGQLQEEELLEKNIIIKRLDMNQSSWLMKGLFSRIKNILKLSKLTFTFLIKKKPSVVHAHNLASLPILVIYKIFYGCKVVYDTHELETERSMWGKLETFLAKIFEFIFIYFADEVVVVNKPIAEFYKDNYSIEPQIINNVPKYFDPVSSNYLKEKFGIPKNKKLFIFIGSLNQNRGIEEYINYFMKTNLDICIVFLGGGPLEEFVNDSQKNSGKIFLHDRVEYDKIVQVVSSADYSITILKTGDPALSHQYYMANKLFESMMSGVPILSGGMEYEAKFVNDNYVGIDIKFNNNKPKIDEAINSIIKKDYQEMRNNCLKLAKVYNWEKQEIIINKYMTKLV